MPSFANAAVEGTRNVISAAADAGVRRIVFTSSYGAVHMDPNRSPDAVLDETCWSDYEYCKQSGDMNVHSALQAIRGYRVRGTARDPADSKNAHLLSLEGAEERLTLCRADVLSYDSLRAAFQGCHGVFHVASPVSNDPELVPVAVEGTRNVISAAADAGVRRVVFTSSYGAVHMDPNRSPDAVLDETCWSRDVARAHVLAYERPDARGRYLCIGAVLHRAHIMKLLKELFPQYPVTAKCEDDGKPMAKPYKFSNQRLRDLGLEFTPLEESLYETVTCLQKKGHLPLPAPVAAPQRAYL